MAESVETKLGGESFDLVPLGMRPARKWREALTAEVNGLIDLFQAASGAAEMDLTDMAAIGELVRSIAGPLLQAPDTIADLAYQYFPYLRGQINEDLTTDGEMTGVFMAALRFSYPLGPVWKAVSGLAGQGTLPRQTGKSAAQQMTDKGNNPDPGLAQAIITAAANPNGTPGTPRPTMPRTGRTGRQTRTK